MWVLDMYVLYKYAIVFLATIAISHGLWNMDTENNPNSREHSGNVL